MHVVAHINVVKILFLHWMRISLLQIYEVNEQAVNFSLIIIIHCKWQFNLTKITYMEETANFSQLDPEYPKLWAHLGLGQLVPNMYRRVTSDNIPSFFQLPTSLAL